MNLVGLLLAAGIGQRYDPSGARLKLLEPASLGPHSGAPIAVAAARSLRSVVPEICAVVRPASAAPIERLHALLADEGCRLIVCAQADEGMGASLACGIRASADAAGWIVTLADMPAIHPNTIAAVTASLSHGATTAAPYHLGQRGHPVGFSARCYDELAALTGDEGARSVLVKYPPQRIDVDDAGCVFDVDLPSA